MAEVPPIPYNEPMVDQSGIVSPAWADLFRRLLTRAGGSGEVRLLVPQVATADIADLAITGAKVAAGTLAFAKMLTTDWTKSTAASGYQKLPSGLYVQWGVTASIALGTNASQTFPVAFPTACRQVVAGIQGNSGSATASTGSWGTGNYSTTGFDMYNRTSLAQVFNYMAIGV